MLPSLRDIHRSALETACPWSFVPNQQGGHCRLSPVALCICSLSIAAYILNKPAIVEDWQLRKPPVFSLKIEDTGA